MNPKAEKFGKLDREAVVERVQERQVIELRKFGGRDKWRRDELGGNWIFVGGKDDWHGIPAEIMEDERQAQDEGVLVLAQKKRTRMDLFSAPLRLMVDERNKLSRATRSSGDYQFTVKSCGDDLRCVQIPNFVLKRFDSIPWSAEDREQFGKIKEAMKLFATMPPEDTAEVLARFKASQGIE